MNITEYIYILIHLYPKGFSIPHVAIALKTKQNPPVLFLVCFKKFLSIFYNQGQPPSWMASLPEPEDEPAGASKKHCIISSERLAI